MKKLLIALLLASGCLQAGPVEICNNQIDDNNNSAIDCDDPGCETDPICDPEICNNGADDNNDGLADCADPQCVGEINCTETNCTDLQDNDNDGDFDCADDDCEDNSACAEVAHCNDGKDNDLDSLEDCDDPDCSAILVCSPGEICHNGINDDLDDLTDCQDPECNDDPICNALELCNNGIDDNDNGATDCQEASCTNAANCTGETNCADNQDNDQDGDTDCLDADCNSVTHCQPEINCANSFDDNQNGLTDCQDPDCTAAATCQPESDCNNHLDDDSDGSPDCQDNDCESALNCNPETSCSDIIDNDLDGRIDCSDDDCIDAGVCVEICDDGLDNDLDGDEDCNDTGCFLELFCFFLNEANCTDGIDDDSDGLIDCSDPNCNGDLSCNGSPPVRTGCVSEIFATTGTPVLGLFSAAVFTPPATLNLQQTVWSLTIRPPGSTATMGPTTNTLDQDGTPSFDSVATFTPDVQGDYIATYIATTNTGEADTCTAVVHAITPNLILEITWNTTADLDIHLLHPTATTWYNQTLDCNFLNCNANFIGSLPWPAAGTADNPKLTIDDINGFGPEQIVIDDPESNTTNGYRFGAYVFTDHGAGPSDVTAKIFCRGALAQTLTRNNLSGPSTDAPPNQLWKIADITFDAAASCNVVPIDQVVQMGQQGVPR
jgi:hypothetical protein